MTTEPQSSSTAPPAPFYSRYAREMTALVLGPITIWIVGWSHPYVFNGAVALVSLLALYEFLAFGRRKGYEIPVVLCLMVATVILAAFVLDELSVEIGMYLTLLVIPASYVFGKKDLDEALPGSAVAVMATMYVGMLGGSLIRLRGDFPEGPELVFFNLLVVWLGDAGAYYTGKKFGKHKLSPRISPKKTIEGLAGGVVTSIITAIVIQVTFFNEFPIVHAIIVGAILSIAGVIGDLAESMWKRSAAVKDSGTLIPGHGGFLDRLDSILFTAPILYIYWAFARHGATSLNIITG
ncbi:MAG TPA: phosphatidate cytidylyltransferase [Thermoanaerobaculia bacterium]|nr:phosphatidate cytidylyltransferase [Thermoanaerobaculia bacterium]